VPQFARHVQRRRQHRGGQCRLAIPNSTASSPENMTGEKQPAVRAKPMARGTLQCE
jgi:hypothetical protein